MKVDRLQYYSLSYCDDTFGRERERAWSDGADREGSRGESTRRICQRKLSAAGVVPSRATNVSTKLEQQTGLDVTLLLSAVDDCDALTVSPWSSQISPPARTCLTHPAPASPSSTCNLTAAHGSLRRHITFFFQRILPSNFFLKKKQIAR